MSLTIIKPGLFDTIQDGGRTGHACCGINPGGVMDPVAAKLANALVGNAEDAALLEMHYPGPQILLENDSLISIAGADFQPTINDEAIPCWQPVFVKKNTVLQFTGKKWGSRAYLAIRGGFCIPKWLNSYSTHIKAGLGGFRGRKLERGDALPCENSIQTIHKHIKADANYAALPWRPAVKPLYGHHANVCFMPGNEWSRLTCCSQKEFSENSFQITPLSDRMGYRLKGSSLAVSEEEELISSAVTSGTMQLLPGGQLIVLMADHQTTGGYPRVGHVVTAHLPKLAQMGAGDCIRFEPAAIGEAEEMLFAQRKTLAIMQRACHLQINQIL